ncbi:TPA: hypothetical protein ACNYZ0_000733, partial [Streptococcus pyogenes]
MLTSKHHNINKLVWRYGLTSAAAVLLAFGGGASSVKAETTPMTPQERQEKINEIKEKIGKEYPDAESEKFQQWHWLGNRFKEDEFRNEVQKFTQQRLTEILDLIEKGATQG